MTAAFRIGGDPGGSKIADKVPRRWRGHLFSDAIFTRLLPPWHGDASGARGAAWLWPPEPAG